MYSVSHHVVVGLSNDGGVKYFGGTSNGWRPWLVWSLVYLEENTESKLDIIQLNQLKSQHNKTMNPF